MRFHVQSKPVQGEKARIRASPRRDLTARPRLNRLIGGDRSIEMVRKKNFTYEVRLRTVVNGDVITVTFLMDVCRESVQKILSEMKEGGSANADLSDFLDSWPGLCSRLLDEVSRRQKPYTVGRFKVLNSDCVTNKGCSE